MIETVQAIRRHVVVQAGQRRAFEVFTEEMTSWWPADHHIGSTPIEEIIIEPHEGGRWYTRHQDGTETSTGYVAAWEPYDRVILTWQIGADWKYDPKLRTSVHLRFIPEGPDRTRLELEHRDLEAYGAEADRMRQIFEQPGAWDTTLRAYAAIADRD
jgi:Activator of Hsp90 ATPase homolog 1-like protein